MEKGNSGFEKDDESPALNIIYFFQIPNQSDFFLICYLLSVNSFYQNWMQFFIFVFDAFIDVLSAIFNL